MLGRRLLTTAGLALVAGLVVVAYLGWGGSSTRVGASPHGGSREVAAEAPGEPDLEASAARRIPVPMEHSSGDPSQQVQLDGSESSQATPGGQLVGRMMDSAGAPLPKHEVHAQQGDEYGPYRSAYCDAEGWFEFNEISPGVWNVSSSKRGQARATSSKNAHGEVRVESGQVTRMDLYLPGDGVLTGQILFVLDEVRSSMNPDAGVLLTLELLTLGDPATVIAEDRLSITDAPRASGPKFPPVTEWTPESVREFLEAQEDSTDAQRLLREGITQELVDEIRKEFEADEAQARKQGLGIGEFRFEGLEPGLYTLRIYFGTKEPTNITLQTPEGPQPRELVLYLERPVEVGEQPVSMPPETFSIQDFLNASFSRL